ncbi:MAG: hypothetical protein ACOH1E_01190 [Brevundimonas sp.]
MTNDQPTPAEALASITAARTAVGERLKVHWGYDVLYGLSCAGIVGSHGLPQPWSFGVLGLSLAGLAGMVHLWRKQTGMWVSGISPPRARWVAFGLGVILLGLMFGSLYLERVTGLWWISLAAGAVAGVIAVVASRLWMRVYLRELEQRS